MRPSSDDRLGREKVKMEGWATQVLRRGERGKDRKQERGVSGTSRVLLPGGQIRKSIWRGQCALEAVGDRRTSSRDEPSSLAMVHPALPTDVHWVAASKVTFSRSRGAKAHQERQQLL